MCLKDSNEKKACILDRNCGFFVVVYSLVVLQKKKQKKRKKRKTVNNAINDAK